MRPVEDSSTWQGASTISSDTALTLTVASASSSSVRRAVPYSSETAASSSETSSRSALSEPRMRSRPAMVSRRSASSSSILATSRPVSRRSCMSRMCRACRSESVEPLHQPGTGLLGVVARPDDRDDLVDVGQRDEQALEQVGPRRGLGTAELRPAAYDVEAVGDEDLQHVEQAEGARLAVDQRHRVDAERLLHRREPVELGQHRLGVEAGLDLDDELQAAVPVGEVLDVGDAGELLGEDQLLDLGDDLLGAHRVGQLGDHDALAPGRDVGDGRGGPDAEHAAAGGVGLAYAVEADDRGRRSAGRGRGRSASAPRAWRPGWRSGDGWPRRPRPGCAARGWWPCRRRCPSRR